MGETIKRAITSFVKIIGVEIIEIIRGGTFFKLQNLFINMSDLLAAIIEKEITY